MSYQEKRSLASLISSLVVAAAYFGYMAQRYPDTDPHSSEIMRFWATLLVVLVPVQMVGQLLTMAIFALVHYLATRETEPPITDERDRLIDSRATIYFYHVFMAGFFVALVTQMLEMAPAVMFAVLTAAVMVAATVMGVLQFLYYRRGF